jgi:hypothetical protein
MSTPPYLRLVHSRAEPDGKKRGQRNAPPCGEIILYFGPPTENPTKPKTHRPRLRKGLPPGWPGKLRAQKGVILDLVKRRAALVRVEGWIALYRFERDGLVYRVPRAHLKVIDKNTIAVAREWLARASPSGWR